MIYNNRTWLKLKTTRLYHACLVVFIAFKYLYVTLKKRGVLLRIKRAQKNWQVSKRLNLYNPTFGATVFQCGSEWRIAQNDCYYGSFFCPETAQDYLFKKWIDENNLNETLTSYDVQKHQLKKLMTEIIRTKIQAPTV